MVIQNADVKGFSVNLNAERTGDNATVEISNKNFKYAITDPDLSLLESYKIEGGYSDSYETIFKGFLLNSRIGRGKLPNTLSLTILERTAFIAKMKFNFGLPARVIPYSVQEIILYYAELMGFDESTEVSIRGDWTSKTVHSFSAGRDNSLWEELGNLVEGFGGKLYVNEEAKLVLEPLYTKETPDITYEDDLVLDYYMELDALNSIYSVWEVLGQSYSYSVSYGSDEWGFEPDEVALGKVDFSPTLPTAEVKKVKDDFDLDTLMSYIGETYSSGSSFGVDLTGADFSKFANSTTPKTDYIFTINTKGSFIPTGFGYWKLNEATAFTSTEEWNSTEDFEATLLTWNDNSVVIQIHFNIALTIGFSKVYRVLVIGKKMVKTIPPEVKPITYQYSGRVWDNTIALYFGFAKIKTVEYLYLNSNALCVVAARYLAQKDRYAKYKVFATVPFNPLIERSDLVKLDTTDSGEIEFFVETIQHSSAVRSFKTTQLMGYLRRDVSWLGVGFLTYDGAQDSMQSLNDTYGTWDNIS